MKIILASNSPRRKEILEMHGVKFDIFAPDIDENIITNDPIELTERLAQLKGISAFEAIGNDDTAIISADTVVYCKGRIFGKPKDRADAERMLRFLSENTVHNVYSGVAITDKNGIFSGAAVTDVFFKDIPEAELAAYLKTSEPYDKAGAYGIQGWAGKYIDQIEGEYYNVMGLPIELLKTMFRQRYNQEL